MSLKQPLTQKLHTNVATVKIKIKGKQFEVACYKNKIKNWRSGIETDLDEVLQSSQIFQNVSRGKLASVADIQYCFPTSDMDEVRRIILQRGSIQISEKERHEDQVSLLKEISALVAHRVVNPETGVEYPPSIIENSLREGGYSCKLKDTSKKQSLFAINFLCQKFPAHFCRAHMSVRLDVTGEQLKELHTYIETECPESVIQSCSEEGGSAYVELTCDPSLYRKLDGFVNHLEPKGILTVLRRTEMPEDREKIRKEEVDVQEEPAPPPPEVEKESLDPKKFKCSKCLTWLDRSAMKKHMQSPWHVFNLKQQHEGKDPVTEEEFRSMVSVL